MRKYFVQTHSSRLDVHVDSFHGIKTCLLISDLKFLATMSPVFTSELVSSIHF